MSDGNGDDFDEFDPYEDLMDLTGGESLPALEDPTIPQAAPPRSPLLTGLIVGLLLVVLSIAAFQLIGQDDENPDTSASPSSTTAEPGSSSSDAPGGTTEDPTSTSGPTTPVVVELPDFVASGAPVDLADLTLAVDSIGPIKLGTSAPKSVGRLITSLGPPDEDSGAVVSTGEYGSCVDDTERIVRWGPLVVVIVVDDSRTQTLGGYRLSLTNGGFESETAAMQTLSGLKLGDSVAELQRIYDGFDIELKSHPDLENIYELRSGNTGNLLLWGPISSADDSGFIRGIFSPDACGRFSL